ncbi:hypothetical protein [Arthrobacter sp. GMC3]|uniref:hypothetical protein n=1 Tax=Arthrobacter sp. GMC3 TaxID=2058894 RepID=UPI000CE4CD57|nr:hypothetical protein [Arthrobacter sp. GMC3]
MATINTPVKGFNGVVVGVTFTDGVGESDDVASLEYFGRQGYKVECEAAKDNADDPFDPAKHNVDEVLAYVAAINDADSEAHDAEVVRILEAERAGKDRKSITEAIEGTPAK